MIRKELHIKRVVYGKADTPFELREYRIIGMAGCPVGTLDDWLTWANDRDYSAVIAWDKNEKKSWKRFTKKVFV